MAFGILALQGGFAEHGAMLGRLGAEHFEIRQLRDIQRPMDGLLLPGGESTVIAKLLKELGLFQPLWEKIQAGLPVFGTCAGLILLAQQVEGGEPCFATMNISVKRNAYGRQLGSFFTEGRMEGVGRVPMTFIRAPYIAAAGEKAQVLAQVNGHIVAARQGRQLVTAFHPELNDDLSIHRWFLDEVAQGLWKR
ncbi:MAG: pyridoxal 5'-phosphate synthase glutaminase subunit PdxT [Oscillospiraceae bacterium]|nr:pyridoxal 5'-phosphate synthase glutaminase subunit PdxT [Oscillospiraceae bacterium]